MLNERAARALTRTRIDFAFGRLGLARFRANSSCAARTPALALRHVPVEVPSLEDLGLPPAIRDLAFSPRGLILVTGRTGSGKSTTLRHDRHDQPHGPRATHHGRGPDRVPASHRLAFIHQREVGLDTASFHDGLRYVLRQDPTSSWSARSRQPGDHVHALMAADTGHVA